MTGDKSLCESYSPALSRECISILVAELKISEASYKQEHPAAPVGYMQK